MCAYAYVPVYVHDWNLVNLHQLFHDIVMYGHSIINDAREHYVNNNIHNILQKKKNI